MLSRFGPLTIVCVLALTSVTKAQEGDAVVTEPVDGSVAVDSEVPAEAEHGGALEVVEPTEGHESETPAVGTPLETSVEALPVPPVLHEDVLETDPDRLDEEEEGVLLAFEPGEGVLISTPDHRFEMNIRSRGMLLLTFEVPEPDATGARPDPGVDLDVRRARITIQGRLFDPDVRYRLQLAIAPRDMLETTYAEVNSSGSFGTLGAPHRSPLIDWYVELRHLRDLHVRVGQFIVPYNRHRVTSSSSLQLVDRSLASSEFNLDRDLGIQLYSPDVGGLGWLRYYAGLFMNEGRDGLFGADLGFLWVARVEVLPFGLFNDYSEGDIEPSHAPHLSVGASYAFANQGRLTQSTIGRLASDGGTFDYHNVEIDAVLQWHGFSLMSEVMFRQGWHRAGPVTVTPDSTLIPRNGMGWFAQAGYLLPGTPVEIAARYGFTLPLFDMQDSPVSADSELGAGVNLFFHRHAFKLQLDYFHLWADAPGGPSGGAPFEVAEERVRVMFQASL
jgi:hypothetical protein